jgi:hypothetical protein
MIIPKIGARMMKTPILRSPGTMKTLKPAWATAAPANPPTRACEELVGMPAYQVIKSQAIAPTSPEKITYVVTEPGSTTPFPIVVATCSPKKRNAIKLKNAAQRTARPGLRTRVETTVAIELAAS